MQQPKYYAIILAAGSGKRFNQSLLDQHANSNHSPQDKQTLKQYVVIEGKTVLEHSIQKVCSALFPEACLLVHAKDDALIKKQHSSWPVHYVLGGHERMFSVLNGLQALVNTPDIRTPNANDFVLVHDGARPCVPITDIQSLVTQTKNHDVGGILATPVTATLKQVQETDTRTIIDKTIPRNHLWQAQTPQLFRFGLLKSALEIAADNQSLVTDDASALELLGHQPLIIKGNPQNIKITYAEDLALARWYLKS